MSIELLKKKLKLKSLDENLLKFYQNPDSKSLNEFQEDVERIFELKKILKKKINNKKINLDVLKIHYQVLRNVFGLNGLCYIGITYFVSEERLFEYFSALIWHFDQVRISTRRSRIFLEYLEQYS